MPLVAIGMPLATLLAGGVAAGSTIVGAKMASGANHRASELEARSTDKALAFQERESQREREQYDREYARTTRLEDERLARLQQFRPQRRDGLSLRPTAPPAPTVTPDAAPRSVAALAPGARPRSPWHPPAGPQRSTLSALRPGARY